MKRKFVQHMALYEQRTHYGLLDLHLKVKTTYILTSYRKKRILLFFYILYSFYIININ